MRSALAFVLAAGLGAAPSARAYSAEVDYTLQCAGCHLADGSETRGKVPALAGSVARFLRAPGGRAYLVRVPGVANAPLGDAALAALLNWMLRRFDGDALPADFAPYAADEVAQLRRDPLVDVAGERRRLLDAIEPAP